MRAGSSKVKEKDLLKAIKGSYGILTTVAERLGVNWHTVERAIKNSKLAQEAIRDENETAVDFVEGKAMKRVQEGDSSMIRFYLATKGKKRGYTYEDKNEDEAYITRDRDFVEYRIQKELFDKQREVFLDIFHKKITLMCSRRAGKTELVPRILNKFCATPDTPCLYINLTFENAKAQCMQNAIDVGKRTELLIEDFSFAKGFVKYSNGSSIEFRGNKDRAEADKRRGFKYRCIIIDEAGHQKNMAYLVDEVLRPTLADFKDSVLILVGTPPRVKNTYFEKACNSKEWQHYSWNMFDNPYIPDPDAEIDAICREKGTTRESAFIQREFFGQIQYDTEAQIFKDYKVFKEVPKDFVPTHIYIGVDYGFSDYNGIAVLAGNVNERKAYVISEYKFNKAPVSEIIDTTRKAYAEAQDFWKKRVNTDDFTTIGIFADTNEKSITYELNQTYGLPAFNAYKYNRDMAIEQLADECRTGRVNVPDDGELVNEFEQIIHPRDDNDNILPGIDDFYHPDITMALLYASRQWFYDCGLDAGGESSNKKTGEF